MNKRGDLVKETLEIILFVVGAVLLVFAVFKVYSNVKETQFESAGNSLEGLIKRAENTKEGEVNSFVMQGLKGWFLIGWSKNDNTRPDKCFFESCICICNGDVSDAKKSCQEKGICKEVKKENVFIYGFNRKGDAEMIIKEEDVVKDINNEAYKGAGKWSDKTDNFILLNECFDFSENNLYRFFVYKNEKELSVLGVNDIDSSSYSSSCVKKN